METKSLCTLVFFLLFVLAPRESMGDPCFIVNGSCYSDLQCRLKCPVGYTVGICEFQGPNPRRCVCPLFSLSGGGSILAMSATYAAAVFAISPQESIKFRYLLATAATIRLLGSGYILHAGDLQMVEEEAY